MRVAAWHVLGFVKVPLVPFGPYRVALHWWPPSGDGGEEIHSHRWGFVSFVLYGTITESRYEPVPGDDFALHRCYPGQRPGAVVEGTCSFSAPGVIYHRMSWRPYSGNAGDFHHARASRPSLTLFVEKRRGELPWSLAAVRNHSPGRAA